MILQSAPDLYHFAYILGNLVQFYGTIYIIKVFYFYVSIMTTLLITTVSVPFRPFCGPYANINFEANIYESHYTVANRNIKIDRCS